VIRQRLEYGSAQPYLPILQATRMRPMDIGDNDYCKKTLISFTERQLTDQEWDIYTLWTEERDIEPGTR